MKFIEGPIQDVVIYDLKKYYDDRGWLAELFRHDALQEEFSGDVIYFLYRPGVQRAP
jgi:dTDP-4-dehydrorhamnose 3,5-epimerase